MLYLLSLSGYDNYTPILLDGPEVDDFDQYCKSFLDEIILNQLKKDDHISGSSIFYSLKDILISQGYKLINPKEFQIDDKMYFYEEDVPSSMSKFTKKIVEKNRMIKYKLYESLKHEI